MRPANFLEFQNQAKQFVFSQIPYTQVKQLHYSACDPYHVSLKLSHSDAEFTTVSIKRTSTRKKAATGASDNSNQIFMAKIAPSASKCLISKDKIIDIFSMLEHMPLLDRNYMKEVCFLKKKRSQKVQAFLDQSMTCIDEFNGGLKNFFLKIPVPNLYSFFFLKDSCA